MPATKLSKAAQDHASRVFDLDQSSLRELNQALHNLAPGSNETAWEVLHPKLVGVHLTGKLSGWTAPKDVITYLCTLLTVKESGFSKIPAGRRSEAFRKNSGGWEGQLENIAEHVDAKA